MAKDNRVILMDVAAGNKVYRAGQEAELAEISLQSSLDQLIAKGIIAGDWSNSAGVVAEPLAAESASASTKAAGRK